MCQNELHDFWKKLLPSQSFADDEFITECLELAAEVLCPGQKHLLSKVRLVWQTVTRRIEGSQKYWKHNERESIWLLSSSWWKYRYEWHSKLTIFVTGIDKDFNVTEEMAAWFPLNATTRGVDIFNALSETIERFKLNLSNLFSAVIDGAPARVGKNEGVISMLQKQANLWKWTVHPIPLYSPPRKSMC